MKTATMADVKAKLGSYLKASTDSPVVVTQRGKPVAVLVGVRDEEELERVLMANSRQLRAILDAADKRIDEGQRIEHDEFWRRVEAKHADHRRNGAGKKKATKR
jgi:prevent-host-death family protein